MTKSEFLVRTKRKSKGESVSFLYYQPPACSVFHSNDYGDVKYDHYPDEDGIPFDEYELVCSGDFNPDYSWTMYESLDCNIAEQIYRMLRGEYGSGGLYNKLRFNADVGDVIVILHDDGNQMLYLNADGFERVRFSRYNPQFIESIGAEVMNE